MEYASIKRSFKSLLELGIGTSPDSSHEKLGPCAYEWADEAQQIFLVVYAEGFAYENRGRRIDFEFRRLDRLTKVPNLLDIQSITSSRDVWRHLGFSIQYDGKSFEIGLPYMIYSIFCPFLARVIREGGVSSGN